MVPVIRKILQFPRLSGSVERLWRGQSSPQQARARQGVKIVREFVLVTRTGPKPMAGALREFAIGRARLFSNTARKSVQNGDSSR